MSGSKVRSAVTRRLQSIETKGEIRAKKTDLGRYSIVPDDRWPNMFRIRKPDGSLTDMVNLTRALDALEAVKDRA